MAEHTTREVLWAAVRRPGLREWTISLIVGSPDHAVEVDAYIAADRDTEAAAMPSCLATYEATATVVPNPDGVSGNLVLAAQTQARDEQLVAAFIGAAVMAATSASTEPPAGWQP